MPILSLINQTLIHHSTAYDFISSLVRIQNNEGFTPPKNPNRDIRDWADNALSQFPEDLRKSLAIFFNQETTYGMALVGYISQWKVEDASAFLEQLQTVPEQDLLIRFLYSGIGPGKEITLETIQELIENDKEAVQFITEHLSFSVEEKWQALQFILNPSDMKAKLLRLLQWYYENLYCQIETEIDVIVRKSKQDLRDRLDKYGEEYLKLLVPIDYTKSKDSKITLVISYFWETGQSINILDNVFVYGYRFFEQIEGRHSVLAGTQVFKTLADETRLNIIRLLSGRPWYGHEIAKRLSISNSTVSHHMTQLVMNGLVRTYREENRVYFELVPSEFRQVIANTIDNLLDKG